MVSTASKKNIQSPNWIGDCRRHIGSRHGEWQCAEDVHVLMADLLLLLSIHHTRAPKIPFVRYYIHRPYFHVGEEGTRFSKYVSFHLDIFLLEGLDEELDTHVPFSS